MKFWFESIMMFESLLFRHQRFKTFARRQKLEIFYFCLSIQIFNEQLDGHLHTITNVVFIDEKIALKFVRQLLCLWY
jgi:hypothetical protein